MQEFVKIPANKNSIAKRKLIYGVAINDAWYSVTSSIDGKRVSCNAYSAWRSMLKRSYCEKYKKARPTYLGVTTCNEWLTFSNFAKWHDVNYVSGYVLDKDIRVVGNKTYGPDTCLYIPAHVNLLLTNSAAKRGMYPIGVSFNRLTGKFQSAIRVSGRSVTLGQFRTVKSAHRAYRVAKNKEIRKVAANYPYLSEYMLNHLYKRLL